MNSGRGDAELQSSLSPEYSIFSLFYKCIFQVSPFTSVSETLQPPKLGVPLFMGGHLRPNKPSLCCLCSAKQAQLARNPNELLLMQKLELAPGMGGIVL